MSLESFLDDHTVEGQLNFQIKSVEGAVTATPSTLKISCWHIGEIFKIGGSLSIKKIPNNTDLH